MGFGGLALLTGAKESIRRFFTMRPSASSATRPSSIKAGYVVGPGGPDDGCSAHINGL
jgi:hypothetical protein